MTSSQSARSASVTCRAHEASLQMRVWLPVEGLGRYPGPPAGKPLRPQGAALGVPQVSERRGLRNGASAAKTVFFRREPRTQVALVMAVHAQNELHAACHGPCAQERLKTDVCRLQEVLLWARAVHIVQATRGKAST